MSGPRDQVEEPVVERLPARPGSPPGRIIPPGRRRIAFTIAIAVDVLQWVALPAFAPGVVSPLVDGLDLATALALTVLLGWNWAFLPTFLAEIVPFVDLVPTWTLAVWLVTRNRRSD